MTDTLLSPDDTGEIPRLHGETRIRIDVGEATQNLGDYVMNTPSFEAIPRRVIDLDETVIYMPETIGLAGPQSPPPPLPTPPPSKYDTERLPLLGSVAGLDGDLLEAPAPKPKLRRSVQYVMPADRRPRSEPRHARPAPLWARAAVLVGGVMAAGAFVALAVLAVAW